MPERYTRRAITLKRKMIDERDFFDITILLLRRFMRVSQIIWKLYVLYASLIIIIDTLVPMPFRDMSLLMPFDIAAECMNDFLHAIL